MGFAVRADRHQKTSTEGSQQQNLVFLHPIQSKKVAGLAAPRQTNLPRVPRQPAKPAPTAPAEVKQLPKKPRLPLGFKLLVGVQQGSTVLTGSLVATALVIYSWTVYLDKSVARAFEHLETLKVATQQVTTANETLKHSMAEQAESPDAGFKHLEPKRAIFLSPAPARPSVQPSVKIETPASTPHPLGY